MRNVPFLAVMMIGVAVAASACGTPATSSTTLKATNPTAPAPTAPPGHGGPSSCGTAKAVPNGKVLSVTNGDNGKSFCMRLGTTMLVTLRGTPSRVWTPIRTSTGVIAPEGSGRLTLQRGVTAAYFITVRPGTTTVTSARPLCASHPGMAHCDSKMSFHMTVVVPR